LKPTGGDSYPHVRAILLLNALTVDLNEQVLKILKSYTLMNLDYPDFSEKKKAIKEVFKLLTEKIEDFRSSLSTARSRLDNTSQKTIESVLKNPLEERLKNIFVFRKTHYKLQKIIKSTLSKEVSGENDNLEDVALRQIHEAYQYMVNINFLDIT